MALLIEHDAGFMTINGAYLKITSFQWNDGQPGISIKTVIFVDEASRIGGKNPVGQSSFHCNVPHDGVTLASLYTELKNDRRICNPVDA